MKNLFLLLGLALLVGCSKSPDDLPAISDTGENTFGAKVDGVLWTPRDFGIVPTGPILMARYTGYNSILINATDFSKQPNETEFEIYLRDVKGPGVYLLNQTTGKHPNATTSYGYFVKRKLHPIDEYITNATNSGVVTITRYDPAAKILSGTFQFQAANTDDPGDLITVSEGRFDLRVE